MDASFNVVPGTQKDEEVITGLCALTPNTTNKQRIVASVFI
jgi:hypothetical protein